MSSIKPEERKQLEEWTGLKCHVILFDTKYDNWRRNKTNFNDQIVGKRQLIFLIEEENGERFGYYLNTEVVEKFEEFTDDSDDYSDYSDDSEICYAFTETDLKSFHFNLQSMRRLETPMKFPIKNTTKGGYRLSTPSEESLIHIGEIILMKNCKGEEDEEEISRELCCQSDDLFDYHGIEKALYRDKNFPQMNFKVLKFRLERLIVIQMNENE